MRNRVMLVVLMITGLVLSTPSLYAKSTWEKMREWFNKKARSTTVKGTIESVDGRKVMFKTEDGQILQLTGRQVDKIVENRGAVLSIFGNVRKPDGKYPTGGMEIRNFRVLEAAPTEPQTPVAPPEPEPVAEPIPEPIAEPAPEPVEEVAPPEPAPVEEYVEPAPAPAEPASDKSYTVEKGDTLAKISKKMYGTTKRWKEIAEANNITNPKGLKVGMNLVIP